MKDKFEQGLFDMAKREKMVVPDTVYDRVDDTLAGLPRHRKIFRMDLKKSLILAAVFVMLFSITVSAAVSALTQRMEAQGRYRQRSSNGLQPSPRRQGCALQG